MPPRSQTVDINKKLKGRRNIKLKKKTNDFVDQLPRKILDGHYDNQTKILHQTQNSNRTHPFYKDQDTQDSVSKLTNTQIDINLQTFTNRSIENSTYSNNEMTPSKFVKFRQAS